MDADVEITPVEIEGLSVNELVLEEGGSDGGQSEFVSNEGADAPATIATPYTIAPGDIFKGTLSPANDKDWIEVNLEAGHTYHVTINPQVFNALDPISAIYNAAGTLIQSFDDGAFNGLAYDFTPTTSGTYYIEVDSFGTETGAYDLTIYDHNDPLGALNWGGSEVPTNNVTVYFANSGEVFDGQTSSGWTTAQKNALMAAMQDIADVTGLTFTITTNPASATFKMVTAQLGGTPGNGVFAYMNPQHVANPGVGVFNTDVMGLANLTKGTLEYMVVQHEVGHALGLAHPHDIGGGSLVLQGVTPDDSADYGDFNLSQGVYTIMSYNSGYHEVFGQPGNFGATVGPMALDLALLHEKYGAVAKNATNTTYTLPDINASGTFFQCIWDTGGTDQIVYNGTKNVFISLIAATLDYSATGGGVVSFANGVQGGYTIANGVVIENANGGSGSDVIEGNSARNILKGNAGFDELWGREGNDDLYGGAQADNLYGGDGADNLLGQDGSDRLFGGANADTCLGGTGNDVIYGESGADRLYGEVGFDTLIGGTEDDRLFGGDQADTLLGGWGNDIMYGENGSDRLFGENGNDTMDGGTGNDVMHGQGGFDTLTGGANNDTLYGGYNWDIFVFANGFGVDTIGDFEELNVFEKIDLSAVTAIVSFADLVANHLTQSGANAVINAGGGNVLTLLNVNIGDLDATDFIF